MATDNHTTLSGQSLRLITGLVLGAVVLALVLWAPLWLTVALFAAVAGLAMWEFCGLALPDSPLIETLAGLLAAAGAVAAGLLGPGAVAAALGLGLALITLASLAAEEPLANAMSRLYRRGFGLLYAGGLIALLMLVLLSPDGRMLTIFLIAVVAAADAGAFYTGTLWGRHKMAPRVSPKKSLEGLAGGLILAAGVGALLALLLLPRFCWSQGAGLGFLLGAAAVLGDLLESLIKRAAGAKDSGNLIPGHGGVLDRIDGLILAAPLLFGYLCLS